MTDATIAEILKSSRTIAVVGASPNPERDSHRVMAYLQERGFRTIPVNPRSKDPEILGEKVYASLSEIPEPVDMVDIFRRSEEAGQVTDEAILIGAGVVWMQLGVVDQEAARRAEQAGLKVVMDRCPMREIPRLKLDR
jgi:predicted CoA-binding protein